jgi:arsenate reductase
MPAPLKVYAYSGCDTCRRALRFLQEHHLEHEVVPIREQPPTADELRRVLADLGGDLRRLFNTSGRDYRDLGLGPRLKSLSPDEAIDLLSRNGNLVKRPCVVTATGGLTGFQEDVWRQRFL